MTGKAGESAETHPLAAMLRAAAAGRFPPSDLAIEVLGPPPGPIDAVVAFSGHNVIATGVDPDLVRASVPGDDPGTPMSAPFLTWLGERLGAPPGMADLVLVADPAGPPDRSGAHPGLANRDDLAGHPRLARARRYRTEVRAYGDPEGRTLVVLGRGLAGRLEVSVEVELAYRGAGLGRAMAEAARTLARGEPLFAQVSPGNVASVRAFLAAGYRPVCGEVLFLTRPAS
jgi:GNAT superfamily N-acetyltransferase